MKAILESPEAEGRRALARMIAFNDGFAGVSSDEAINILSAAPIGDDAAAAETPKTKLSAYEAGRRDTAELMNRAGLSTDESRKVGSNYNSDEVELIDMAVAGDGLIPKQRKTLNQNAVEPYELDEFNAGEAFARKFAGYR
ncbi:MAG: hypothetical protein WDN46_06655 [Methylocella sp.]